MSVDIEALFFTKCKINTSEDLGYYVDPSYDHLKEILLDIYENPEQLVEKDLVDLNRGCIR